MIRLFVLSVLVFLTSIAGADKASVLGGDENPPPKATYLHFKVIPMFVQDVRPRLHKSKDLPTPVEIGKSKYLADLDLFVVAGKGKNHAVFLSGKINFRSRDYQWKNLALGPFSADVLTAEAYNMYANLAGSFGQFESSADDIEGNFTEPSFNSESLVLHAMATNLDLSRMPTIEEARNFKGLMRTTEVSLGVPPSILNQSGKFPVEFRISYTLVNSKHRKQAVLYRNFFTGYAEQQLVTPEISTKISNLMLLKRNSGCESKLKN